MKKFKVPSGTIQKLETVFDKVQSFVEDNLTNRVKRIFSTYGPTIDLQNGVVQAGSDDLTISIVNGTTNFSIASGKGLTESNEYITLGDGSLQTMTFSDSSDYSAY